MTRVGPHVPGEQGTPVQLEAPAAECVPDGQSKQPVSDGVVAPRGPYCPARQIRPPLQVSWPETDVQLPLGQGEHTARAAEVAPLGPAVPGLHGVPTHVVEPGLVVYVPGAHLEHGELRTPPTEPWKPAGHMVPR